jgi:prolyl-tRNA synthetase
MGLLYATEDGQKLPVFMGSYGIGLGRLMGTVVEVLSDEKGIVWPESIAPFKVHLISLSQEEGPTKKYAEDLYSKLTELGIEVLYDDRDLRAGEKFADSDLLGIPHRLVVSDKTVKAEKIEWKKRNDSETKMLSLSEVISSLGK